MLRKTTLVAVCLLMMIAQGMATSHINETVDGFRISFEGKDDINIIAKAWNPTDSDGIFEIPPSALDVKDSVCVIAGNTGNNSDIRSTVVVLIMDKPVQITEWEKEFFENSSEPYIRVYDRTIDGHKGIFAIQGDSPDDPSMERMGLYWLNEAEDGTATELILVVSSETEIVADNMINTVHVEKITRH